MKLHLPKGLRSAVLACMAVVSGIATTVGTGFVAGGAMTIVIAGAQVAATEYVNPDLATTTFANGDVLNLGSGQTVSAPLTLDAEDSTITLNVTDGTVTWAAAQGKYLGEGDAVQGSLSRGVSVVNVKSGALLDVTTGESRFCVFACKDGAELTINLESGASMCSSNIFGWDNTADGNGVRVVNMAAGSEWTINDNTTFYLNNSTINLNGGKLVLGAGSNMSFERRSNTIGTTTASTQMSVIAGSGKIHLGNNATEFESLGYRFNVERGSFTVDSTNTSDLRLDVALENGGHGVQKTGSGLMEMTADSSACTASFFVRGGELMFSGSGNMGSSNMRVDSGATLTLNTSALFGSAISLSDGATLQIAAGQKLNKNATLNGTVEFTDTVTLKGGTVTFGETAKIDLSGWIGGDSYQLFTADGGNVSAGRVQVIGSDAVWEVGTTGILSLVAEHAVWSAGNALTWAVDTQFDGGKKFSNGMITTFEAGLGDVTATVETALSPLEVEVGSGTNLILVGSGTVTANKVVVEGNWGINT